LIRLWRIKVQTRSTKFETQNSVNSQIYDLKEFTRILAERDKSE